MLHAGLTGSIAVGKSFVLGVFGELGCHTADADAIAREVVAPEREGWQLIRRHFGTNVFDDAGELNRAKLGAVVFADKAKRELLNSLLHPIIINRQQELMREWEMKDARGVSVIEAALIIEAGGQSRFDKLIVVQCREEVQIERLIRRNKLSAAEAEQRITSQMSQAEKLKHADFVIDSSDGFAAARAQTEKVFHQLKRLASNASA